jgi:hypothetical protein
VIASATISTPTPCLRSTPQPENCSGTFKECTTISGTGTSLLHPRS